MRVFAAEFTIFTMFTMFAGNIESECWGSKLPELKDINIQFLEQVWWEKTEMLAHVEKTEYSEYGTSTNHSQNTQIDRRLNDIPNK